MLTIIGEVSCVLVLEWNIGQVSWSWYSSIGISIRRIICSCGFGPG